MAIFDFLKKEKTSPVIDKKKETKQEKVKKISKKPVSEKIKKPSFVEDKGGEKIKIR